MSVKNDDIVTRLRETGGLDAKLHNLAADEIERLRELLGNTERLRVERDEARRLVCELASAYKAEMIYSKGTMIPRSERALAKAYGWDCFKEEQ